MGEEVEEQQFHNKNQEDKGIFPAQQTKYDGNNTEKQTEISEKIWENVLIKSKNRINY